MPVLDIRNLSVKVRLGKEKLTLVDDVSFSIENGECLGILGESGSGKSMTCKAFMGLLDSSFEVTGRALFDGADLFALSGEEMRRLRGNRICMILQNPMTCFDPLCRIGAQMAEGFFAHTELSALEIKALCKNVLESMQIRDVDDVLEKYPHQLSGGMLQRVMIGLALAMKPRLIIADEPTTAIDSITQYEIVEEFRRIKESHRSALIFISHDLGVVSRLSDKVVVMNEAKIVQSGSTGDVLRAPSDSYTQFLIEKKMTVMERFLRTMHHPERKSA